MYKLIIIILFLLCNIRTFSQVDLTKYIVSTCDSDTILFLKNPCQDGNSIYTKKIKIKNNKIQNVFYVKIKKDDLYAFRRRMTCIYSGPFDKDVFTLSNEEFVFLTDFNSGLIQNSYFCVPLSSEDCSDYRFFPGDFIDKNSY